MLASPNDLIYFTELANSLNISRAAERIGISQPSLSTALKRLENIIGAPLFIRTKKGLTLTQAGKNLLLHSKHLIELWESVKAASLAAHIEVQGTYRIGCHSSVALHGLTKFLPKLLSKYPHLDIQLIHHLSRNIVEAVVDLSIDVGIVVNPSRHPDLVIKKLYEDKVTLWHAPGQKSKLQDPLSDHAVIICDPELLQTQWLLKRLPKAGIKFNRIVSSSNLEVIAGLTAQGCGIGILPSSVALASQPKLLKPLAKMPAYSDEIALIYRGENREIKAIQAITREIINSLS